MTREHVQPWSIIAAFHHDISSYRKGCAWIIPLHTKSLNSIKISLFSFISLLISANIFLHAVVTLELNTIKRTSKFSRSARGLDMIQTTFWKSVSFLSKNNDLHLSSNSRLVHTKHRYWDTSCTVTYNNQHFKSFAKNFLF